MARIILASNSPRRQELLRGLDIDFTVDTGNTFEESPEPGVEPHQVPVHMSVGKSHGFHRPLREKDEQEARDMLRMLSGRAHEVVTSVTIRSLAQEETFSDSTIVHFAALTDAEIDYYIRTRKPFDKAGAYGIQEWIGYAGITSIEGSYFNVMGFPVHRVWAELRKFV